MTEKYSQAYIFGRYLLGAVPSDAAIEVFQKAMAANGGSQAKREQKVVQFAYQHPWSIGFLDSGLALIEPQAELRRRLYVMFSILESMPEYHDRFLPKKRSWWYGFVVVWAGARGAAKAVVGIVLAKVVA